MSFADTLDRDARLCILKTLAEQTDGRLSDRMLQAALDSWGFRKSADYVRTQLNRLAEIGAVRLPENSDALVIGEITAAGLDHVHRRLVLSGVRRPEPGE